MEKVERRGDGLEALQEILTALAAEEAQSLRAIVSLYLELSLEKLRGEIGGFCLKFLVMGRLGMDGIDGWWILIVSSLKINLPSFFSPISSA